MSALCDSCAGRGKINYIYSSMDYLPYHSIDIACARCKGKGEFAVAPYNPLTLKGFIKK